MMVAKKAQMKPVGVLRGISIGSIVAAPSSGCLPGRALLHAPIGFLALDIRQHGEIERRRRRRRRPFQRAAVPRIAGHVAQRLALADADDELDDLAARCRTG